MKEQNNEMFFVQVRQPTEVRRHILETLKEIVKILQKFEKFKHMRHEKLQRIQKLRNLLKDSNKMLGNLKAKLPQTNLRAAVARESPSHPQKARHKKKKKGKAAAEEKEQKMPKKEMTELDKLEAELIAIESKLKSLT